MIRNQVQSVSQEYVSLQCFAIDLTLLPVRSELRVGDRGYTGLAEKQEDPSLRFL